MSSKQLIPLWEKWSAATAEPPDFDEDGSRHRWVEAFSQHGSFAAVANRGPLYGLITAAAVLLLMVGAGGWWWGQSQSQSEMGVVSGAWLETREREELPMHFAEGSEVVVHGNSRVHVESVDPRGASMIVERGSVSANIVHRAETRWGFIAGPFRVRVTGTELAVEWDPKREEFSVSVATGSVLVTGPLIEGGRKVGAGQRCRVAIKEERLEVTRAKAALRAEEPLDGATEVVDVEALPLEEDAQISTEGLPSAAELSAVAPRDLPKWQRLEQEGRYAEAMKAAAQLGVGTLIRSGNAGELMSLARAARLTGQHEVAGQSLRQLRARYSGSRQAATAAFLLGRSAAPAEAAGWFATYLREYPSGLLAREASGRLIESLHRAGRFAEASDAARRYLASYPSGPHAAFARSVLGKR